MIYHEYFCVRLWYSTTQKRYETSLPRIQRALSLTTGRTAATAVRAARLAVAAAAATGRTARAAGRTARAAGRTAAAAALATERSHQLGEAATRIARAVLTRAGLLDKTALGVACEVPRHSYTMCCDFFLHHVFRPKNWL